MSQLVAIGKPEEFDFSNLGLQSITVIPDACAKIYQGADLSVWCAQPHQDCFCEGSLLLSWLHLLPSLNNLGKAKLAGANVAYAFASGVLTPPEEWKEMVSEKGLILFEGMRIFAGGIEQSTFMKWVESHWDLINECEVLDHWEFGFMPKISVPDDALYVVVFP